MSNPPNTPAPVDVFNHDADVANGLRFDSHGLVLTGRGRFLWVADRAANRIEVVRTSTDTLLNPIELAGGVSGDPAPDSMDIAPSGKRVFVTLRGPMPLSGDTHLHTAVGSTPGVGVVRVKRRGRRGLLRAIAPISHIVGGVENADPHAVKVRREGRGCPVGGPAIRTLAYVETECRGSGAQPVTVRQRLQVRRGDCDEPVTLMEFPALEPGPDQFEACRLVGVNRAGIACTLVGVFQRVGVSPDASGVVFEVTEDFSRLRHGQLPPDQKGIFFARSDGRGLRRLGPASRDASYRLVPDLSQPASVQTSFNTLFLFSPDGRRIVFTDLGPDAAGEEASQIVTLELATGQRTQVTRLSSGSPLDPAEFITGYASFADNETILFFTSANPDGMHPEGGFFTVKTDGTALRALPAPVVLSSSRVVPTFKITGPGTSVLDLSLPGTPVNGRPGEPATHNEVFVLAGKTLLQLTNFNRNDTLSEILTADRRRAVFRASADPLGTNGSENCQLFSIDTLGAHLRQLTHFRDGEQEHAPNGCRVGPPAFRVHCQAAAPGPGDRDHRVLLQLRSLRDEPQWRADLRHATRWLRAAPAHPLSRIHDGCWRDDEHGTSRPLRVRRAIPGNRSRHQIVRRQR